ncbi:MAG TPA: hypothetical protein VFM93_06675 [Candidatus Limnocylindria bacterium]|nr:hypothetical protein [Candidatus Limnocylindria bacterium]
MNRNTYVALGVVVAVALFFGGFAVGRTLAPAAPATDGAATDATGTQGAGARRGLVQGGQGAAGANVLSGRVLSVQDGSITVEVRQPAAASASPSVTSTIALVGSGTRIVKSTETQIALSEIKAGDTITVVGSTDAATGTVSATAVLVGGNALQQLLGPGAGAGRSARPVPTISPGGGR